jgi:C4-dicarboxylate-specific signal transduction histidine kinase
MEPPSFVIPSKQTRLTVITLKLKLNNSKIEPMDSIEKVLSSVRHQFGNTINALQITLGVLNENYHSFDEFKKKEYLQRISKVVEQQRQMIGALKSYSVIDGRDQTIMPFSLWWGLFVNVSQEKCKGSKIQLASYPDPPSCWIKGNRMALNRIAETLVENAIEALWDSQRPEIALKSWVADHEVALQIADNGSGIKTSDMDKVWLPMFTTKKGKHGMGLAIAQKLVQELTGRIEIDSVSGLGTTVRIWLKSVAKA